MTQPPPAALVSPSSARNREPILEVLKPRLRPGLVLEIASGAGEHAVHFASAMPQVRWQPTDWEDRALSSIAAWRDHAGIANLLPPLRLDAADPAGWPIDGADAVVCINMVHISPWAATEGLMDGASRILSEEGLLFLYGPYFEDGVPPAPSNIAFDEDLRRRNPGWGLRRRQAMETLAARFGFSLTERIEMPANNLSLVFRRG